MVGVVVEFTITHQFAQGRILVIQLLTQGLQVGQRGVDLVHGLVQGQLLERFAQVSDIA